MKITAGIADPDQLLLYASAGTDEVFCGYVPESWISRFGRNVPLNRREVSYCPVQIGGRNELRILRAMSDDLGIPVSLTFNSPFYTPEALPEVVNVMEQCLEEGFDTFIVADPALMNLLKEKGLLPCLHLQISGEAGEINREAMEFWRGFQPSRIIFHRKTGLENIRKLIVSDRTAHPDIPLEYEAFAMNENCHFNGAFCSGLHCDEFAHLCHLPWKILPVSGGTSVPAVTSPDPLSACEADVAGHSGCGICAIPALCLSGIGVLKVVGRGAGTEEMCRDIHALRTAVGLVESGAVSPDALREACFPEGCSHNCYYTSTSEVNDKDKPLKPSGPGHRS